MWLLPRDERRHCDHHDREGDRHRTQVHVAVIHAPASVPVCSRSLIYFGSNVAWATTALPTGLILGARSLGSNSCGIDEKALGGTTAGSKRLTAARSCSASCK